MLFRESYPQFPGRCFLCSGSSLPCIDTERDDPDGFEGSRYICNQCVATMAVLMSFVEPEKFADLEDELERTCERLDGQETENADLAAENATLKEAMNLAAPTAPAVTPVKRSPGRPRKDA